MMREKLQNHEKLINAATEPLTANIEKKEIIYPIKKLFLKYFEVNTTY